MADNKINVTVSANTRKNITVSSAQQSTEITASTDTGRFWAQTAKNWAVSDVIVDNTDFSSKHYAQEAKESAISAGGFETSTRETYNSFLETSANAITELQGAKEETLTEIDNSKANAIESMNTVKTEAIDSLNSTKTTILNDIEFVADGEKKEIGDLIDSGKDEIKESIGDIKVLTTLEIGDIGIAPLGIDETKGKRRYLNGQLIIQDQYAQFTNKVKSAIALYPSLACTESEWQTTATMTVGGQVGKFVVDDNAGTIRLPKIIMPIQGLTDLSKLAEIVEAGLPNIEGTFGAGFTQGNFFNQGYGAFGSYRTDSINTTVPDDSAQQYPNNNMWDFDASRSSSIYGNSNTVQQEQIQYPYFIQVATGAETEDNIINEIELNNPFSLLDYKYSEYELNNLSWLRSNGQYNSKAIYPAVYDLLLKIYNGTETKAGVSVKLSTETFTDYDFVLNTAEETFRLPIKVKLASGKVITTNSATSQLNNIIDWTITTRSTSTGNWRDTSLTSDIQPPVDGAFTLELSDSDLYLYFYVGETVQNANLVNVGRIEEKVAGLIPDNSALIAGYGMPTNRYEQFTMGASMSSYTAPANGWFQATLSTNGNSGILNLINTNVGNTGPMVIVPANNSSKIMMPVKRGDVIKLEYTSMNTSGFNQLIFIYAEGEV